MHRDASNALTRRGFLASCMVALLGECALAGVGAFASESTSTAGALRDLRVAVIVVQSEAHSRKRLGSEGVCRCLRNRHAGMSVSTYAVEPGEEGRLKEIIRRKGGAGHDAYIVYLVDVLAGGLTEIVASSGKPMVVAERCCSSSVPLRHLPRLKRLPGASVLPAGTGPAEMTRAADWLRDTSRRAAGRSA